MNARLSLGFSAVLILILISTSSALALKRNGFDLDNASIPQKEIFQGGPPKDGIPAIDRPKFLSVSQADFMQETDRLLGVVIEGEARAYPIKILDWHEIVNDRIGDTEFVVTYCPLCGTGMVFTSDLFDSTLNFGVSGLLYQSDVLLYDRQTESLWSQILGEAVSGELVGKKLQKLPVFHTDWKAWVAMQPESLVLSTETGFRRDYTRSPYAGYENSSRLFFAVNHQAPKDFHAKENVLGIEVDGKYKAYPFSELKKQAQSRVTDRFAGESLTIHWDEQAQSAHVTYADGELMASLTSFWFAWYTFHPETAVFRAK